MSYQRSGLLLAVITGTALTFGCSSILHELQPHRMWKWNSGPAPSLSPDFSNLPHRPVDQLATTTSVKSTTDAIERQTKLVTVRGQNP